MAFFIGVTSYNPTDLSSICCGLVHLIFGLPLHVLPRYEGLYETLRKRSLSTRKIHTDMMDKNGVGGSYF